jgi:hypothetical protein
VAGGNKGGSLKVKKRKIQAADKARQDALAKKKARQPRVEA